MTTAFVSDVTVIRPDGSVSRLEMEGIMPPLNKIQELVGGTLETVPYFSRFEGKPCVAYCYDESRVAHQPFNAMATALWRPQVRRNQAPYDEIYGNVVIIQRRRV